MGTERKTVHERKREEKPVVGPEKNNGLTVQIILCAVAKKNDNTVLSWLNDVPYVGVVCTLREQVAERKGTI